MTIADLPIVLPGHGHSLNANLVPFVLYLFHLRHGNVYLEVQIKIKI